MRQIHDRLGCQQQPLPHHAEIGVAIGQALRQIAEADLPEADGFEQRGNGVAAVEPFGEDATDDADAIGLEPITARDETLAVLGEAAFAADQQAVVQPLTGSLLEMRAQPVSVHEVERQVPALPQQATCAPQQRDIFLDRLEIAEGIAEDGDAIELAVRQTALARIALDESHVGARRPRPLPRQFEEIMREVDAGHAAKPPPRQFDGMTPLAAAEVEYAVVRRKIDAGDHRVDVRLGVCRVLEDVAIGFAIEIIEDLMPPVGPDMALKVADRADRTRAGVRVRNWPSPTRLMVACRGILVRPNQPQGLAANSAKRSRSLGFMSRHQVILLKQ